MTGKMKRGIGIAMVTIFAIVFLSVAIAICVKYPEVLIIFGAIGFFALGMHLLESEDE